MNKEDFETKSLNELCEQLSDEGQNITSYETLKDFAKTQIDEDYLFLAEHIISAIKGEAKWYFYDYYMGTLETPTPITSKDDIEDLIED